MDSREKDKFKKEILDQLLHGTGRPLGMSEEEWEKTKKEKDKIDRAARLQYLKDYKRETLAQRIELAKLNLQESKFGKTMSGIGRYTSPIAGAVGGTISGVTSASISSAKAVSNSKMGKGILQTIMYSNPITALIAENSDLLKGLGKAGIGLGKAGLSIGKGIGKLGWNLASDAYSLFRGKGLKLPEKSSAQELLTAKEGKNYILTKSAVFVGGKNYIIAGGKSFDAGGFGGLLEDKNKLGLPGGNPFLLEDKQVKETKKISQGITGLLEDSKKSNKLLDKINNSFMLTGLLTAAKIGLVLTAVGTIIANIDNILNLFNVPKHLRKNVKDQSSKLDKSISMSNSGLLNASSFFDTNLQQLKGNQTSLISSQQSTKSAGSMLKDYKKQGLISDVTYDLAKGTPINPTLRQYKSTGNITISFPVPTLISGISKQDAEDGTVSIRVDRIIRINKNKDMRHTSIIITKVSRILFGETKRSLEFPAKTPICEVLPNYQIIGDLSAFKEGDDSFESFQNKMMSSGFNDLRTNYINTRNDDRFNKELIESSDKLINQANTDLIRAEMYQKGFNWVADTAKEGIKNISGIDLNNKNITNAKQNMNKTNIDTTQIEEGVPTGGAAPAIVPVSSTSEIGVKKYDVVDPLSIQFQSGLDVRY